MTEANAQRTESFIVCLDDDRDFLNSLRISLPNKFRDGCDYNLLFLDNPLETLEVLKELVGNKEQIALLMTDQMMPQMRGIDFLKEAKEITPDSMRVLLTGYAGTDSAIIAINDHLLHKYLTKPIADYEDLVVTLQRLLNEFHLQHTVERQQQTILKLHEFGNTLNSLHSLEDILNHVVSYTSDALECQRVSVLLLEEGNLVLKAGTGLPEEMEALKNVPLGQKVAGGVLKHRAPLLIRDVDNTPWLKKREDSAYKSFISMPVINAELYSSDVPLGVINVTNKKENREFSDVDLRTLSFISNSASIAINNHYNVQRLIQSYVDTVEALITALEAKDQYTKGHSLRVMKYSVGIAQCLKLDPNMLKLIKDAAILHDLGKIGIRDDILLKPGRLTDEEMAEIKKHPAISASIVKSIFSLKEVGTVVRQHHERYDGNGYPDGISGEEIHIAAKIMAVADTFDAMSSDRPYRRALDMADIERELRKGMGSQFDPVCVDAMFKFLGEAETAEIGQYN